MQPLTYIKFLLHNPRFFWPSLLHVVDVFRVGYTNRRSNLPPCVLSDREVVFYQDRAGWLIDHVNEYGVDSALNRYLEIIRNAGLMDDAYSASQRIAKATYLFHLRGKKLLPPEVLNRARLDAIIVADNFEFRTNNTWFNNHLLNNYRALILYAAYFMDEGDTEKIEAAINAIGKILERHASSIFESSSEALLCEGSVSYEILGLKILADLAACSYRTALTDRWSDWLVREGKAVLGKYRYAGVWLVPQVGDLAPNWTNKTMTDFMNGFWSDEDGSIYRKIWAHEFARIGI
ncbi:MAG: hypothetical protein RL651_896 [Pseudomonadota bacterium]